MLLGVVSIIAGVVIHWRDLLLLVGSILLWGAYVAGG